MEPTTRYFNIAKGITVDWSSRRQEYTDVNGSVTRRFRSRGLLFSFRSTYRFLPLAPCPVNAFGEPTPIAWRAAVLLLSVFKSFRNHHRVSQIHVWSDYTSVRTYVAKRRLLMHDMFH